MNQDIKKKWVDALKSGEYTQGQFVLRSFEDTYCCLGVLCDLYAKETGKGNWQEGKDTYLFDTEDERARNWIPSTRDFTIWSGLSGWGCAVVVSKLVDMNDGKVLIDGNWKDTSYSFNEIAQYIE